MRQPGIKGLPLPSVGRCQPRVAVPEGPQRGLCTTYLSESFPGDPRMRTTPSCSASSHPREWARLPAPSSFPLGPQSAGGWLQFSQLVLMKGPVLGPTPPANTKRSVGTRISIKPH